jgi:hypothetical protein
MGKVKWVPFSAWLAIKYKLEASAHSCRASLQEQEDGNR